MTWGVITPYTVEHGREVAWSQKTPWDRAIDYCRDCGRADYVAVFDTAEGIGFLIESPKGRAYKRNLKYREESGWGRR